MGLPVISFAAAVFLEHDAPILNGALEDAYYLGTGCLQFFRRTLWMRVAEKGALWLF